MFNIRVLTFLKSSFVFPEHLYHFAILHLNLVEQNAVLVVLVLELVQFDFDVEGLQLDQLVAAVDSSLVEHAAAGAAVVDAAAVAAAAVDGAVVVVVVVAAVEYDAGAVVVIGAAVADAVVLVVVVMAVVVFVVDGTEVEMYIAYAERLVMEKERTSFAVVAMLERMKHVALELVLEAETFAYRDCLHNSSMPKRNAFRKE